MYITKPAQLFMHEKLYTMRHDAIITYEAHFLDDTTILLEAVASTSHVHNSHIGYNIELKNEDAQDYIERCNNHPSVGHRFYTSPTALQIAVKEQATQALNELITKHAGSKDALLAFLLDYASVQAKRADEWDETMIDFIEYARKEYNI